ncbi:helicase associated domain-containing protein [Streptomyces sp. NPDC054804]
MVWSVQASAWEAGLAVTRSYAQAHGHLLPPTAAGRDGFPIGVWLKNQRAAARKTVENAERRAARGKRASRMPGSCQRPVWRLCPTSTPDGARRRGRVEAQREGWLGEVEGLQVSLAGAEEKLAQLGAWLDNTRRRAGKLSPERRMALDELGMRW